jgi:hypothetical protein
LPGAGDPSPYGFFFFVERGRSKDLAMQLHVTDRSRIPAEVSQLPLVPEAEFFDSSRSILGVRLTRTSRASLRIFELDAGTSSEVILRFFDARPNSVALVEKTVRFTPGQRDCTENEIILDRCPGDFVHHPGYILIGDLVREFPELSTLMDTQFGIRVEVTPSPGLRFWMMATVTDNGTNHVTVYTVR